MALTLRYDDYDRDCVLTVEIQRADPDGISIDPPLLMLTIGETGDVIHLTKDQARQLRTFIGLM